MPALHRSVGQKEKEQLKPTNGKNVIPEIPLYFPLTEDTNRHCSWLNTCLEGTGIA